MIFTNAFWEEKNLGVKTCEVLIEPEEDIEIDIINKETENYEYIVIKTDYNFKNFKKLEENGYHFIETQLTLKKNIKGFDINHYSRYKSMYDSMTFEFIDSEEDLEILLEKIDDDMFRTDRIYLDDFFRKGLSANRYKNWLRNEFIAKKMKIFYFVFNNEKIGFLAGSDNEFAVGGIFNEYQNRGLGGSMPIASIKYIEQYSTKKFLNTGVSVNNKGIMNLYFAFQYAIKDIKHVFIKHVIMQNKNNLK